MIVSPAGPTRVDLLQAAVAAAHSGSKNKERGRGRGVHQSVPFRELNPIEWYNTRGFWETTVESGTDHAHKKDAPVADFCRFQK